MRALEGRSVSSKSRETRELLGGMKENSVSLTRGGVIDMPFRQINDLSQKGNREKLS